MRNLHLGYIHFGDGPNLAASTAGKTRVGCSVADRDGFSKGGVSLLERDNSVAVRLGRNSASARLIALSAGTVASLHSLAFPLN